MPPLKPGQGRPIIKYNKKLKNKYIKKIRKKKNLKLFDHVVRNHNLADRKRFKEMSKNKWTFEELLKKKPQLRHKKQSF